MAISQLNSQVVINEYSASNLNEFLDNYGKYEDWIELYNTSDNNINIGGWHLSDKKKKPGKYNIPQGTIIPAKGYLVFWCSGRNEFKDGHFHTNFKLSQTSGSDDIVFSDAAENILEKYDMTITMVENSYCRMEDGSNQWMICTSPTPKSSNTGTIQYKRYSSQPKMSLAAGFYEGEQTISINNYEPNSVLHYTTDGKTPTDQSEIYSSPLNISKTTVIKARSFSNDPEILAGQTEFNTYFINENFSLPVFSVSSNDVEELANGNAELEPIGSLEYFNTEKERETISYGEMNKHGQDSWVLPHRSIDWISRDEMGYNKEIEAKLFTYSDRNGYQRVMFRNSGDDNYPAIDDFSHRGSTHIRDEYVQTLALEGGMHLDTRAVRRVVLFLNGKFWGVYGMREKTVDHDFTDEYYGQDKYDIYYLTTWQSTKAKYGGKDAFNDWYEIRDFILNNDMSLAENYHKVEDRIDLISFIDYFIVNLNVVAKDWLNYNTGWWRGLDPTGTHKKWGYILWDLDATFDYYINYTGIPNSNADAVPCDIDDISISMDEFFGQYGSKDTIANPEDCFTIKSGSCPYPYTDSIFVMVINFDHYCCNSDWDQTCQNIYDNIQNNLSNSDTCETIRNGSCPYDMDNSIFQQTIAFYPDCCSDNWSTECQELYNNIDDQLGNEEVMGNVGKHEKLFIKLQEESEEFKQLYYSRQADMMNTVFSCENMNSTLNRMLAKIEPDMPQQIERWGGSMSEWQDNVNALKSFINERCGSLDEGMTSCFNVSGPFNVIFMSQPEEVGKIKVNTIEINQLPWEGNYFGIMNNKISAQVKNAYKDKFEFSHWVSTAGNIISPNEMNPNANVLLNKEDSLIAVFTPLNSISDKNKNFTAVDIYPNPTRSIINIRLSLKSSSKVEIGLYTVLGEKITILNEENQYKTQGIHMFNFDAKNYNILSGLYFIKLNINNEIFTKKIVITN